MAAARLKVLAVIGLGLLAACSLAQPASTPEPLPPTLRPPLVQITRQPTITPSEIPQPANTPLPGTLAELARAEFGERLIDWVQVDAIGVYAPVTPVGWLEDGEAQEAGAVEWESPGASVGWALGSGLPGAEEGNVVLYGHNNIDSRVFRRLADLQAGDEVLLATGEGEWRYEVAEVNILPVLEAEEDRAAYAQYLLPSAAPRLTLVSCWPPDDNTHRVIVVAYPKLR